MRFLFLVVFVAGCQKANFNSPPSPQPANNESPATDSKPGSSTADSQPEVSINQVRRNLSEFEATHPKAVTRSGAQLILSSRKKEMLDIFLNPNRTQEDKYAALIHLMNVLALTGNADALKGYLTVIEGSFKNFDHSWYFPEIAYEYCSDPAGGTEEIAKELEIIKLGLSLLPAKNTGDAERRRVEMKNYLLKREKEAMEKMEKTITR